MSRTCPPWGVALLAVLIWFARPEISQSAEPAAKKVPALSAEAAIERALFAQE